MSGVCVTCCEERGSSEVAGSSWMAERLAGRSGFSEEVM